MKTTKLNFANANSSLSRSEMKNIMAGSKGKATISCWCPGAGCATVYGTSCSSANCGGREGCFPSACY